MRRRRRASSHPSSTRVLRSSSNCAPTRRSTISAPFPPRCQLADKRRRRTSASARVLARLARPPRRSSPSAHGSSSWPRQSTTARASIRPTLRCQRTFTASTFSRCAKRSAGPDETHLREIARPRAPRDVGDCVAQPVGESGDRQPPRPSAHIPGPLPRRRAARAQGPGWPRSHRLRHGTVGTARSASACASRDRPRRAKQSATDRRQHAATRRRQPAVPRRDPVVTRHGAGRDRLLDQMALATPANDRRARRRSARCPPSRSTPRRKRRRSRSRRLRAAGASARPRHNWPARASRRWCAACRRRASARLPCGMGGRTSTLPPSPCDGTASCSSTRVALVRPALTLAVLLMRSRHCQ